MFKILVFIVVIIIVIYIVKKFSQVISSSTSKPPAKKDDSTKMIECDSCSTFVSEKETKKVGDKVLCSECRKKLKH
ncbi:hypothetical protein BKH43_01945 [Helicobacter sp. 13S00401-1]|uniref:PP0621 family protein n=1 Tax=Helicobacter sp. 13S00401-1 TaxID=1905758 RepID=UPI000BA7A331|nr:PP0621 family protein [Helicobacter sp. 13S00401-1]PAF51425.1 hypothetical protein BKH43_01945 [Helicobacter sp. 13S00401-1]